MQLSMKSRARGFSLIEVLVALMVISVGLLGIAKMQALALANTNGGRLRALASIEAASLASSLQGNPNYWGTLTSAVNVTIASASGSATVSSSDTTQSGTVTCPASAATNSTSMSNCSGTVDCTSTGSNAPCTAKQMAAYDLQQWAGRLQEILGTTASASIACSSTVVAQSPPWVSCQITVNWVEDNVNSNAAETGTMGSPTYSLFVTL